MNDLPRWEEPPPDARGGRTTEACALARTRPGEWLRMPGDYSASTAVHIRRSVYAHLRGEKWEARSAAAETAGRHHIWIRYMGEA